MSILIKETVCLNKIKGAVGVITGNTTTQPLSHYKRLIRIFDDYSFSSLWLELLEVAFSLLRLKSDYLLLDGTSWQRGSRKIHYLTLCVVYQGVAIPVYWEDLQKKGTSNIKERKRVVRKAMKYYNLKDKILLAEREYIGEVMSGEIKRYMMRYADSNKRVKREIYGFAEGDTLYINSSNYDNGYHFVPIQEVGAYCYLEDAIIDSDAVAAGAVLGGLVGGALAGALSSGNNGLVLSPRNGKYYVLNKKVMRQLLANDAELLGRYDQERKPKQLDVMRQYITAYNERHEDALPDFATALEGKIVVYRRDKKQRSEPVVITVADSTVATLPPNEFYEVTLPTQAVLLCAGASYITVTPSTQRTTYLECSFAPKAKQASLEMVKSKVGVFYVKEIGYKQAKR